MAQKGGKGDQPAKGKGKGKSAGPHVPHFMQNTAAQAFKSHDEAAKMGLVGCGDEQPATA